ncbi:hypothetical protein ACFVTC_25485 [Streptomyces sp. NPDC057950]|uniref:hypothetical protein n=1 Tax=Streptomyces sp. NPDC057950 TaxID=3346288 RepID=UPI0036E0F7AE
MKSTLRSHTARALAAGALSAALLSAGTAGAFAAAGQTAVSNPLLTRADTTKAAPSDKDSITIKADKTQVKARESVTFTGRSKGLKIHTKVTLQHKKDGKWNSLKASTTIKNGSGYTLKAKLNTKGKEQLRVMADKTVSPTVTVTVK